MLISPEYDAFLVRTARTVKPYLSQLVFVGGCAGALYTRTSAASSGLKPIVTKDIDIAGSIGLETPAETLPLAKLMTEAGFAEEFLASAASSPIVKYVPQDHDKTFDVEFLCPLRGRRRRHSATKGGGVEINDGLLAQPLQYLNILLIDPWRIDLVEAGLAVEVPERKLLVRIPNPAAYVVQKVLIRDRQREEAAKRKDCYYIYTIAVMFREAIDVLQKCFQAVSAEIHPRWVKRFRCQLAELFADASAEGPDAAVEVHRANMGNDQNFIVNAKTVCTTVQRLFPAFDPP